ncbi:MAG: TIGR04282 family arsenosugar biosynthesis glycosyltransferase [Candidatus Marivariicella sp.]
MKQNLLIIFSKNSILGKVKSRLAKSIGEKKALKIYKLLVKKTINVLFEFKYDMAVFHSDFIPKKNIWNFTKYQKIQNGRNLGNKMKNAFQWGFNNGYNKILIIGTDLWDLEEKLLIKSYEKLKNNDVVFGPAFDGGYYLLGLKKMTNSIFEIKSWGTNDVLKNSLKRVKGKSVYFLPMLNDIDDIQDLKNCNELINLV